MSISSLRLQLHAARPLLEIALYFTSPQHHKQEIMIDQELKVLKQLDKFSKLITNCQ